MGAEVGGVEEEEGAGGVHCHDTERLPHTFSTEQVRIIGSPSSNEELLERDTVMLLSGEEDRQRKIYGVKI